MTANGTEMPDKASALSLLSWHLDAGVDETLGETPRDRLSEAPRPQAQERPSARPVSAPPPPQPAGRPAALDLQPVATAEEIARGCGTVEELREAVQAFDGCALKATATTTVFADGNPEAALMLIGEAPGAEEDRRGLPFVGSAGRLLDRMLAAIGRDRTSAYISNMLFWRPPGNRVPTAEEIAVCKPFVHRHIELVSPKVLVCVGGISAKTLLDRTEGITRLRGRWFAFSAPGLPEPIPTMGLFHPAYLLRQPAQKREAWRDLLAIEDRLNAG